MSKKKQKPLTEVPVAPAYDVRNREENDNLACIHILEGKFAGVVYHYGIVTLGEEAADGSVPLHFDYVVVEGDVGGNEGFEEVAASILHKIVTDFTENANTE